MDEIDVQFIAETYPDPAWPVIVIAHKLDMTKGRVETAAKRLGLRREEVRTPSIDWRKIWHQRQAGSSCASIANELSCSESGVEYAVNAMTNMSPEQREQAWLRYERKQAIGN